MTGYPTTATEVRTDWLTSEMRALGSLGTDTAVATIDVEPTTDGVGFMGEVARLHLGYDGPGPHPPTTVIAKIPTQNPDVRALMKPTRVFERETRFYREIADASPLRTPKCYVASMDAETDEYFLVLEDLSALDEGDQLAGLSAERAAVALRGLARHHAAFWGGRHIEHADFIPDINSPLNLAGQQIYAASLPGFLELFGHLVHPSFEAAVHAFPDNVPQLLNRFFEMPHTLVHFDWRADNLFFGPDETGTEQVLAIDWQTIGRGGGAADVGYFLSQNLSIDDRRANEDMLLGTYHDTLVTSGVSDYAFDRFRDDYRVGIMYGWVIPVFATGTLDASSDRAIALWTEVINRAQAAIEDNDAAALLTT